MFRLVLLMLFASYTSVLAFTAGGDVAALQKETRELLPGERIAFWAEQFVGTPYDTDPLGEYVKKKVIVADERVDCMYLTFRAVELALGKDPDDSLRIALNLRFIHQGKVEGGKIVNYEDRFQYGEDMIESGKWGKEITPALGETIIISGPSGKEVVLIPPAEIFRTLGSLRSGDIVFFVNSPKKIASGTVVGHIGIIKIEPDNVYLLHASGRKETGGRVKKVLFRDYLSKMPFAGIRVCRFPADVRMSE
jgi:hypothetical protein